MLLLYVVWCAVLPAVAMAVGFAGLGYDPVMTIFLPLVALSGGPLLGVALGFRSGQVWAVRLIRILAIMGTLLLIGVGGVGILLALQKIGHGRHDQLSGEFLLLVAAILTTPAVLLFRAIIRTRWLDPRSTAEEWEPPLRRSMSPRP